MNQLMGGIGRKNIDKSRSADGAEGTVTIYKFNISSNTNELICLNESSIVNVVSDNGNKYVFNNLTSYNKTYGLGIGIYTLKNIPIGHPLAILNNGINGIAYEPIDTTPITIKVSGGAMSPDANGDYYTFTTGESNTPISLANGSFRIMRGRTYRFEANNIDGAHPFKVFVNGSFVDDAGISGTGAITEVTIPIDQDVTSGAMYYQCANHTGMKGNLTLTFQDVVGSDNNGGYDFYYGDVKVTVTDNFNSVSLYCLYHGYMGGNKMFTYTTDCNL
tara:strand:- start:77 stop:901 length:825 start_codon:yes stop_codon:yes gene_type:complete